jgi:hypothetical protein
VELSPLDEAFLAYGHEARKRRILAVRAYLGGHITYACMRRFEDDARRFRCVIVSDGGNVRVQPLGVSAA